MTTLSDPKAGDTAFVSTFSLGAGDGPTVAVKDCIDIAGMVTRCGSAAYADFAPAAQHAAVIERLLSAGCRIVGKARMHEIAYGMTGVNAFEGTPVNPRWRDRIPGGSSSGSAVAVAAGAVDFAIGTDTGGSVRQPAICCGVIGLKPTFGSIDRTGALPAESSLDCIGPFARDMTMIERAMTAIAPGFAPVALDHAPRLGKLNLEVGIAPEMGEALDAIADATAGTVTLSGMDDAFKAAMTIIARETLAANLALLDAGAPFGDDIKARLEGARAVSDAQLEAAKAVRRTFTAEVDAALETVDAIVTPALPSPSPLLSEAHDPNKVLPLTRFLRPFNLSGHPAIVLPAPTSAGLPSGVQIIARRGEDARLCAIARRLCEAHPIFQVKDY
ncbi:MAG: amidase [Rhizobiaceae bacterium]|nr:amidase [Rhizobiaceae bacterium]